MWHMSNSYGISQYVTLPKLEHKNHVRLRRENELYCTWHSRRDYPRPAVEKTKNGRCTLPSPDHQRFSKSLSIILFKRLQWFSSHEILQKLRYSSQSWAMSFLPSPTWWSRHVNMRTLYLLLLGQLVSFVLALMSFTSSLIANLGNYRNTPRNKNPFRVSCFFWIWSWFLMRMQVWMLPLHRPCSLTCFWLWFMEESCCIGVRNYGYDLKLSNIASINMMRSWS